MIGNIEKFFNELLPAAMLKYPEHFEMINMDGVFIITGEGGGQWYVNSSYSGLSVIQSVMQGDLDRLTPGIPRSLIIMSAEDFLQNYQDSNTMMELYLDNKITIESLDRGYEMFKIFSLVSQLAK